MKQFVNDITGISRKSRDEGVKYWGRIAGTKADKEMEEYAARRFREFGLQDVRMQPFNLPPQWVRARLGGDRGGRRPDPRAQDGFPERPLRSDATSGSRS